VARVGGLRIVLSDQAPEHGLRPSVSWLFRTVAQALGPHAVGVLLTGMGRDGAEELRAMKDKGAITIAQDKESSVIHGMPGEAIKLDAATCVLPPEGIISFLAALGGKAKERIP
jgi:two-component system chemotaxis response regulator CheB